MKRALEQEVYRIGLLWLTNEAMADKLYETFTSAIDFCHKIQLLKCNRKHFKKRRSK